jgi:hypothetical protein
MRPIMHDATAAFCGFAGSHRLSGWTLLYSDGTPSKLAAMPGLPGHESDHQQLGKAKR